MNKEKLGKRLKMPWDESRNTVSVGPTVSAVKRTEYLVWRAGSPLAQADGAPRFPLARLAGAPDFRCRASNRRIPRELQPKAHMSAQNREQQNPSPFNRSPHFPTPAASFSSPLFPFLIFPLSSSHMAG